MKKLLEQIGVRLYAFRYIPEYKNKVITGVIGFVLSLIALLNIYETAVY